MALNETQNASQAEKDGNDMAPSSNSNGSWTEQGTDTSTSKKRKLPPFFDHFTVRELKILLRCSVALWVASLFLFIDPVLETFGQATFFAAIAVLFLPPSGVVLAFLFGGFTEILGMALGWAWGVITQKAALATRPASVTLARESMLGQQAQATGTSATVLIFNGFMLDTRVTVTYFSMIGLFIYLMVGQESARLGTKRLTLYRRDYV